MDHFKNLKVKDIKVILIYYLGSKMLKGSPNKVELLKDAIYFSRNNSEGLVQREGYGRFVVTNESDHQSDEEIR